MLKLQVLFLCLLSMTVAIPASADEQKGKPTIPKQMSLTGILVKAKIVSVSDSKRHLTENSWTEVVVSLSHVYRGEQKMGDELKFSVEGWLGSENEKADFYRKAMEQEKEVIIPLATVYNPFLKVFTNNYGGNLYLPSGEPLLATDENVQHATEVAAIPIGWNYQGKELISTWSAVDKAVFQTKDANAAGVPVCAKTGRPGYLTDPRLEMRADLLKNFGRPGASAQFEISIKNPTDKPIKIESLRSAGGKILWNESILFVNDDKVWLPIGFEGFTENTEAVVIEPGQTLKGEMPWTAQGHHDTLICLGNRSFSIYINMSSKIDARAPFQSKPTRGGDPVDGKK